MAELGCGAGRMTRAFAPRFHSVIAIDISEEMQSRARELLSDYPNVNWVALFTKLGELERKPYDWSAGVASLKMPLLLIFADADAIRPEHIVEFYGLLGGGKRDAGLDGSVRAAAQLAVLPGVTHYNITSSPILPGVVATFLDAPPAMSR